MAAAKGTSLDRTLRAIADPTRRRILQMLAMEALTVGGICEHFEVSQPAISQHMRVLREAELVEVQAEWRHRTYRVKPQRLREVLAWVQHFEKFWEEALDRLDDVIQGKRRGDA